MQRHTLDPPALLEASSLQLKFKLKLCSYTAVIVKAMQPKFDSVSCAKQEYLSI